MATAKKPAKVMDTVHASDTPPTPSARPVLVTNRPFMTVDPMLTAEQSGKGEEKPSGEPAAKPSDGPSGAPRLTREGKNLAPVINQVDEAEQPAAEDTPAQETVQNETSEPEKPAASPSEAEQTVHHTGGIKITPPKHDTPEEPKDEPEDDDETEADTAGETEAENPEENPEAARNLELERHIAAGTYFVPIGQVKRRRRKVILLTVFILLAAILVLDLLLDMEILKLDSIPHTSFFK